MWSETQETLMIRIAKAFLYLQVIALTAFGLFFLFFPAEAAAKVSLLPVGMVGTSELRAFYGGSFISAALMILVGLRSTSMIAPGLLAAIGGLMACIVLGRIVSLLADGVLATTLGAGVIEALIAYSCLVVFRQRTLLAKSI